jgi:site-specific recombinase XerD
MLELVPSFKRYLSEAPRSKAKRTVVSYGFHVSTWLKWKEAFKPKPSPSGQTSLLDEEAVALQVFMSEYDRTHAARSHNLMAMMLRGWWDWLILTRRATRNPARDLKLRRTGRPKRQMPSPDDVRRLVEAAEQEETEHMRALARAIVLICAYAGLRRAELRALEIQDVDCELGIILVRHGKGDKERRIPIHTEAKEAVKDLLSVRPKWTHTYLTAQHHRGGLSEDGLRLILRRLGSRAGLSEEAVTPHAIRHGYASRLDNAGVPLATISALLGHSNIATTAMYLHSLPGAAEAAAMAIGLPGAGPQPPAPQAEQAPDPQPPAQPDRHVTLRDVRPDRIDRAPRRRIALR